MVTYAELLAAYRLKHGALVEPAQGWGSLERSLWLAYSIGRKRGYYDVGTYADKPGDHGIGPPCFAFDLRRRGWVARVGWGWINARRLAAFYWRHHDALSINYVIRGRSVISRSVPRWHRLATGDTSHDWHIHVSGVHAG